MKIIGLFTILFMVAVLNTLGCAIHDNKNLEFSSNEKLLLINASDVDTAEKIQSADFLHTVKLELNEQGIHRLFNFTESLVGETLSLRFGDIVIYDNIPIVSAINMKNIFIPVKTNRLADDIIDRIHPTSFELQRSYKAEDL